MASGSCVCRHTYLHRLKLERAGKELTRWQHASHHLHRMQHRMIRNAMPP